MNPVPLLPLALLGVERAYRRPQSDSGWIILALAVALSFYAGFPETAYLDGLFVVAWAVLRLVQADGRGWLAARYLLGGGIGLLLTLPLLVPLAEYLPSAASHVNQVGIGYQHLTATALPVLGLPYFYGPIGAYGSSIPGLYRLYWTPVGGFLSATTIILGIAGILGSRRDPGLRYLLVIAGAGALLWAFGAPPYAELSHILPYMNRVVVMRLSPPIWELAAVIAACFGLEALGSGRRARIALLVGSATMLGVATATMLGNPNARYALGSPARSWAIGSIVWASGAVGLLTWLGGTRRRRGSRRLAAMLLVLDAAAMAFIPQLSAPRAVAVDTAPVRFLARHLHLGRFYSFGVYRPNYDAYFGVSSLNWTDPLTPPAWRHEIKTELATDTLPGQFDGASLLHRPGPSAITQAAAHLRAYEYLDVRYFVVHDPEPAALSNGHGLAKVFDDGFVSILALPHPTPYFTASGASCAIQPRGRDLARTDCTGPATLVRAGLYLPGWSATVNGHPARLVDYDQLLTAVRLSPGRSTVRFSYTPPGIGGALAGLGVGLLLLTAVPAWRRRRLRGGERLGTCSRS